MAAAAPVAAAMIETHTPLAVCIARATPAISPAIALAAKLPLDCTTPQTSFGHGSYWAVSPPLHATGPVSVTFGSLWQTRVTLHALYADGARVAVTIDEHGASRRMQLGAMIEQELPARATPLVRVAWQVEDAADMRGIVVGARIGTPADAARTSVRMAAIYAGFAGLCIALIFHNLALWGALRHPFQLTYCVMAVGLLAYAASSSGALAVFWPAIANNDRLRINYLSLAFCSAAAMSFARTFFEPRVFAGWLTRASHVASAAVLLAATAVVLLAPWQITLLDRIYSAAFVGQVAIVCPVLWRAWRLRSNFLWMFALAWAAPIILACARVANALLGFGWSFWLDNSTISSMALEALLSSLAIAYRIRLLSRERDEAREQEVAARLLADTDPLTGLLNRRAFLRQAIGRDTEQQLLLIDIDHFKSVNDKLGHDGGDEVLRVVARTLRVATHLDALVARIGGEEFAILAPLARPVHGEAVLARLRGSRMPFDIAVTASIGASDGPIAHEGDWKALYRAADEALFKAKASGRDRVCEADAFYTEFVPLADVA